MKAIDLTGMSFGRLKVLSFSGKSNFDEMMWLCACECGGNKTVRGTALRSGKTKSCGCISSELTSKRNFRHGMSGSAILLAYRNMIARCTNKKSSRYKNYGGRGVSVCERWLNGFLYFYEDMKGSYKEGLTLERIDVNGNYEKNNCTWVSKHEQAANKVNTIFIEINGEKIRLIDASSRYGISYAKIWQRYRSGDRGERLIRRERDKRKTRRD